MRSRVWRHARRGPSATSSLAPQAAGEHLDAGDWPSYNRDLAGTRFSPLEQIEAGNVAELKQVWVYPLGRNTTTGSLTGGSETTPIAIAGTLFVTAADRVVALRADTGQELWRYLVDGGSPSRRGLAYWPGERDATARVFFTAGRRLIALDAATGRKVPAFGGTGEIEMPVVYNGAPTRFENLLIVGSNTPPGGVRAFDARTGEPVWVFDAVPQPDEPGRETWGGRSAESASVVDWSFSFTVDVDRALLYVSLAGPPSDEGFGGDRAGVNLYANSVVALDARSGERRWHFQTVHHDVWNYDLPAPPALLDVAIGGATVPVLAQASKSGYLYVLNRVTGEPVFGMEERAVAASDVPGEHLSPTQPIPLKPAPIARVGYAPEDLVTRDDTTAAHADFCRALRERGGGLQSSGPFTPYRFRAEGKPPRSTLVFPGSLGGANWGGAAADPALGFVFVNTSDVGSLGWLEAAPDDAASSAGESAPTEEAARYRRASALRRPVGAILVGRRRAERSRRRRACVAVPEAAVGATRRGQRGERRHRLDCSSRRYRATTRGQTADRPRESRRADRDRGRARLHRRDERSTLPRVQRAHRRRALGREARAQRARGSDHLSRRGRQAVRGDRRRGRKRDRRRRVAGSAGARRVRFAVTLALGAAARSTAAARRNGYSAAAFA